MKLETFVKQVIPDEVSYKNFLQLLEAATSEIPSGKLHLFYGTGGNGKTTLANAMKKWYHQESYDLPSTLFENHPVKEDLSFLQNKRFLFINEHLDEARLKTLITGDPILYTDKNGETKSIKSTAEFIMIMNVMPRFDSGMQRRLNVIEFDQVFSGYNGIILNELDDLDFDLLLE